MEVMMGRLFRPFFRGVAEIDSQIEKFRDLRGASRPEAHTRAGTWTVGPHGLERDPEP
ncbi:MAG TPA: hypothetical protein VIH45_12870 [Desulfuromonadaceae bacterium]